MTLFGARREHDGLVVEQRADIVGGACAAIIDPRLYDGVADRGQVLVGVDVIVAQGIHVSVAILHAAADGAGRDGRVARGDADGDRSRPAGGRVERRLAAGFAFAAVRHCRRLPGRRSSR